MWYCIYMPSLDSTSLESSIAMNSREEKFWTTATLCGTYVDSTKMALFLND